MLFKLGVAFLSNSRKMGREDFFVLACNLVESSHLNRRFHSLYKYEFSPQSIISTLLQFGSKSHLVPGLFFFLLSRGFFFCFCALSWTISKVQVVERKYAIKSEKTDHWQNSTLESQSTIFASFPYRSYIRWRIIFCLAHFFQARFYSTRNFPTVKVQNRWIKRTSVLSLCS